MICLTVWCEGARNRDENDSLACPFGGCVEILWGASECWVLIFDEKHCYQRATSISWL